MNYNDASLIIFPDAYKVGKLYALKGDDLNVVRATSATRVNASGVIETVGANVPRLDYTNGTCPSILVEPQRTNLALYSEQFDNINWTKSNMNVTANSSTSPDGTTTADTITVTSTSAELFGAGTSATTTTTSSVFVKKGNQKYFGITINGVNNFDSRYQAVFDLDNGTIFQENNSSTQLTNRSAKIESYANGWYKVSVTATFAILAVGFVVFQHSNSVPTIPSNNLAWNNSTNGNTFIWGAQLEAGSYATSYIPTTSASVTRNADLISKTGISSLIGQTEGTLFIDVLPNNTLSVNVPIRLDDTTSSNIIQLEWSGATTANLLIASGGSWSVLATGLSVPQNIHSKIAIAYKINDFVLYVNGTQKVNDTSGTVPVGMSSIRFNKSSSTVFSGYYKTAALWKTRLSNSELAEITSL